MLRPGTKPKSWETHADKCCGNAGNFPHFPRASGREVVSIKSPEGFWCPALGVNEVCWRECWIEPIDGNRKTQKKQPRVFSIFFF